MAIIIENEKKNNRLTIEITDKAYAVLDEKDITILGIHIQEIISKKLKVVEKWN